MSEVFGLRKFYGRVFRVAHAKCYGDQIVVQVQDGAQWLDFSRCTATELEQEYVTLHTKCCRCSCDILPSVTADCEACFRDLQASEAVSGC